LAFGLSVIVSIIICLPIVAYSELWGARHIYLALKSIGKAVFAKGPLQGSIAFALAVAFGVLAIFAYLTFRNLSSSLTTRQPTIEERQRLENRVLILGIVTGVVAALLVFLIEYSKHLRPAKLDVLGEIGLAALAGILVALFVFVGSIVFSFDRKITAVTEDLSKIIRSTEIISTATTDTERAASAAQEAALIVLRFEHGPKGWQDASKHLREPASMYLRAVTELALLETGPRHNTREILQRVLRSYMYEEAYDIWKQSLVTNPRNYAMFLSQILYALATHAAEEKRLGKHLKAHMYIVTRVGPRYAFAWPREGLGHNENINGMFVLPFLAEYYLFQQEILAGPLGEVVSIRRWVGDDTSGAREPALAAQSGDGSALVSLLPLMVSDCREIFPSSDVGYILEQSCAVGYRGTKARVTKDTIEDGLVFRVILSNGADHDRALQRLLKSSASKVHGLWRDRYDKLRSGITAALGENRERKGDDAEVLKAVDRAGRSLERISELVAGEIATEPRKVLQFYEERQRLSVFLAEHVTLPAAVRLGAQSPGELAETFADTALYVRMARLALDKRLESRGAETVQTVDEAFRKSYHSPVAVGSNVYHQYTFNGGEGKFSEFVVFALTDREDRTAREDCIVGVTASVDHPWKSAEIKIHTNLASDDRSKVETDMWNALTDAWASPPI